VAVPSKEAVLAELDKVLKAIGEPVIGEHDRNERIVAQAVAAVERFAAPGSHYARRARDIGQERSPQATAALHALGLLQAFREDVAEGRLRSLVELVHAETFSDFLDMAQHLVDQGYKDAAAVVAGSTLEAHIRALCHQVGIQTDDASGKPKKADGLNVELEKAGVYGSKLDLKNVVAWLDLRNKAAHGEYETYESAQVSLLVASVRDFMTRLPA
jgi:hypothetical protein